MPSNMPKPMAGKLYPQPILGSRRTNAFSHNKPRFGPKVLKHTYRGGYEIREWSWERSKSNENKLERSPVSDRQDRRQRWYLHTYKGGFETLANVKMHRTSVPTDQSSEKNNESG